MEKRDMPTCEELATENAWLREENRQLREKVVALKNTVIVLEKAVSRLEEIVARLSKNSGNSSKPPSSDIVKPGGGDHADGVHRHRYDRQATLSRRAVARAGRGTGSAGSRGTSVGCEWSSGRTRSTRCARSGCRRDTWRISCGMWRQGLICRSFTSPTRAMRGDRAARRRRRR